MNVEKIHKLIKICPLLNHLFLFIRFKTSRYEKMTGFTNQLIKKQNSV